MSKAYANDQDEDVPLQELGSRLSLDSTGSQDLDHLLSDDGSEASSIELPPVDGGLGAWTCLLGCWLVEAMIWGLPLSFGVFLRFLANHELFRDSNSIPLIGTMAAGVAYLGMPFVNVFAVRWPRYRWAMCVVGWVLSLMGLVAASFANAVWQLVVLQGFVYGLGWVICYTPQMFIINEWFVEKRGLAYGILFGASGVSGMIVPIAVGWMLERYGFRTAMRVYAVAIVVLSGPGLLLIRTRAATAPSSRRAQPETRTAVQTLRPYATNMHFLIMAAAVFIQGQGFFLPNMYIPTFAEGLDLSTSSASGLLALLALFQVFGQLWQGWVSDKVNIYLPLSMSALLPGLGALLLWGPAKGYAYLAFFVVLWGLFSASYSVLFTRMCSFLTEVVNESDDRESVNMIIYSFFNFERGVSIVLSGPISSWLVDQSRPINVEQYGLGRYASVTWFTTICMLASSLVGIGWLWNRSKKETSNG
ncbi:hypothetical protein LTR22_021077 [Elasticomyces elasticus]|nr:hypothetical protein LTR22_021077 [Elasticomyces elasticus]KAK4913880.1 hypothetical protein LTR49_017806 [Elasticomyces elasticus]KAK5766341.1 hypothetical protein LTS12_003553 [Elasticomyces elasticus]